MLGYYKSYSVPPIINKPWLALSNRTEENNTTKRTPLHFAIHFGQDEECAIDILSMDMDLHCSMLDEDGNSLLFLTVQKGYSRVAEKILNCNCSYSLSSQDGSTALHVAPRCSGLSLYTSLYSIPHLRILYQHIQYSMIVIHI